jgi:hypothetical protein
MQLFVLTKLRECGITGGAPSYARFVARSTSDWSRALDVSPTGGCHLVGPR